jgi:hypothetical protein
LHTLDIENYRHSQTNLTSLRIVDESNPELRSLMNEWHIYATRLGRRNFLNAPQYLQVLFKNYWKNSLKFFVIIFKAESSLIYDALKLLVNALHELYQFDVQPIYCESGSPWPHGSSIINYMRQVCPHLHSNAFNCYETLSLIFPKIRYHLMA